MLLLCRSRFGVSRSLYTPCSPWTPRSLRTSRSIHKPHSLQIPHSLRISRSLQTLRSLCKSHSLRTPRSLQTPVPHKPHTLYDYHALYKLIHHTHTVSTVTFLSPPVTLSLPLVGKLHVSILLPPAFRGLGHEYGYENGVFQRWSWSRCFPAWGYGDVRRPEEPLGRMEVRGRRKRRRRRESLLVPFYRITYHVRF